MKIPAAPPLVQDLLRKLAPPDWLRDEVRNRIVLLANHVLQQEPQAMERLKNQSGKVVALHWQIFDLRLQATPAGLLAVAPADMAAQLRVDVADPAPALMGKFLKGEKPNIRIEGDAKVASDINWLIDNVRWDMEEDLSRIVGDVPAHQIGKVGKQVAAAMRQFAASAQDAFSRKP